MLLPRADASTLVGNSSLFWYMYHSISLDEAEVRTRHTMGPSIQFRLELPLALAAAAGGGVCGYSSSSSKTRRDIGELVAKARIPSSSTRAASSRECPPWCCERVGLRWMPRATQPGNTDRAQGSAGSRSGRAGRAVMMRMNESKANLQIAKGGRPKIGRRTEYFGILFRDAMTADASR